MEQMQEPILTFAALLVEYRDDLTNYMVSYFREPGKILIF